MLDSCAPSLIICVTPELTKPRRPAQAGIEKLVSLLEGEKSLTFKADEYMNLYT